MMHPWRRRMGAVAAALAGMALEHDYLYGQRDFVKMEYFCSSSCRKDEDVILSKNEKRDEKVKEEKVEKVEDENGDTKVEIELSS